MGSAVIGAGAGAIVNDVVEVGEEPILSAASDHAVLGVISEDRVLVEGVGLVVDDNNIGKRNEMIGRWKSLGRGVRTGTGGLTEPFECKDPRRQ